MTRTQKLLKRKSKYILTMESRYGIEKAHEMIQERTSKAGRAARKEPRGFAIPGVAQKAQLKSAESRRKK